MDNSCLPKTKNRTRYFIVINRRLLEIRRLFVQWAFRAEDNIINYDPRNCSPHAIACASQLLLSLREQITTRNQLLYTRYDSGRTTSYDFDRFPT